MDLIHRFKDYIRTQNLFSSKDKLLLAVSGGIDSVVLCELCKRAGFDFSIAHCNFQLRGAESERDESFVRALAKKYAVKIFVKKFETEKYAAEKKIAIMEAARELRYTWFSEIVNGQLSMEKKQSFPSSIQLLTAHHEDDNIETLIMNFCRGTGLKGLTGIPVISTNANVRRPLLDFWKEDLLEFAAVYKLDYVEDSSNQSLKYTRNLFRNELLPRISKVYPHVKENLRDNIDRFKEIKKLYDLSVSDLKKKLIKQKNGEQRIPIKQLMAYQSKALIFEIFSEYGFTEKQVDEVIKLTESGSGKYVQSPSKPVRIIKFRNWLIIASNKPSVAEIIIIEEGVSDLELESGKLGIKISANTNLQIPQSTDIACFDFKEIQFPLLMRKWKHGDYFYPLGMKKKKKLSRFFIDQKFSKTQKEKVWVIEANKKIIWIVGHRIDERFKITGKTQSILQLTFKRNEML